MIPKRRLRTPLTGVTALLLILPACEGTVGENIGTAGGAVLGGVVGSQFGSGTGQLVATGAGAVIGSQFGRVIGGELEKLLSEEDQVTASNAAIGAASDGDQKTWVNQDSGVSGRAEVVETREQRKDVQVKVLKDRLETPPPLEMVGEPRVTAGNIVNVRGGPSTEFEIVDNVRAGDQVHAVGRVEETNWLLVAQNNTAIGYIREDLLRAPAPAEALPAEQERVPEGETTEATVSTTQQCRDVKQDVTLADGTTKTHTTRLCRTPNGWAPQEV